MLAALYVIGMDFQAQDHAPCHLSCSRAVRLLVRASRLNRSRLSASKMSRSTGKGKQREKQAEDSPAGHTTATQSTSTAKRRKHAPHHLDLGTSVDTPSTSDDDEPGITVKLRPNRRGLRIEAVSLSDLGEPPL